MLGDERQRIEVEMHRRNEKEEWKMVFSEESMRTTVVGPGNPMVR